MQINYKVMQLIGGPGNLMMNIQDGFSNLHDATDYLLSLNQDNQQIKNFRIVKVEKTIFSPQDLGIGGCNRKPKDK